MKAKEPKLLTLVCQKGFGDIKKGDTFTAYILGAVVKELVEYAQFTIIKDGEKLADCEVPYQYFKFVDSE